ncbi:syncoilin-like isoform X2 [Phycodurus eques]|uniref:syncoilin-like isoform X2 n=1 Tax=Phycodurus eques TaxID=693459 RepID=UPI002ACDEABA|nr:syncoilin-like isoform X2 [Phycodurus eques]
MDNQDKVPTEEPPTDLIQFIEDIKQSTDNGNLDRDNIPKLDKSDMENIGQMFEHCIEQVSCLEMRREELIQEFLFLQEPMKHVVDQLRGNLVEKRRLVTLAQMDHMDVFEEVQQVKKKLFNTARACIHSQEELKAQVQCLTEEFFQRQESHQNHLNSLRDLAKKPCRQRAMSDISLCRQASVHLQRRLSVSIRELEGWYEPRLIALLKRRQFGEKALRVSNEETVILRAQLDPLKQEVQRLEEQRSCLKQRLNLMQQAREEMITQHKEAEEELKEALRKLMLDFEVQIRHKRDLEARTNDILEEMAHLRVCDEATGEEQPEDSTSS